MNSTILKRLVAIFKRSLFEDPKNKLDHVELEGDKIRYTNGHYFSEIDLGFNVGEKTHCAVKNIHRVLVQSSKDKQDDVRTAIEKTAHYTNTGYPDTRHLIPTYDLAHSTTVQIVLNPEYLADIANQATVIGANQITITVQNSSKKVKDGSVTTHPAVFNAQGLGMQMRAVLMPIQKRS